MIPNLRRAEVEDNNYYFSGSECSQLVVKILCPGDIIGDVGIITKRPRSASILAIEDNVQLFFITAK